MSFARRLRLYLLGVLLGGALAWLFFGKRLLNGNWLPEARIKKRLETTLVKVTPEAEEALAQWPSDLEHVRAAIPEADVILKETRRRGDTLIYVLDGEVSGRHAHLLVAAHRDFDADSTATLISLTAQ